VSWVIRSSCSRIIHCIWKSASWIRCLWFPMPPSRLNFRVISSPITPRFSLASLSFELTLFFTVISPIFLEYLQRGYFFSFFGVIVCLPIRYPFAPVLILPIVISIFLCLALAVFSLDFFVEVFSFFEMYPFSPGRRAGVFMGMISFFLENALRKYPFGQNFSSVQMAYLC